MAMLLERPTQEVNVYVPIGDAEAAERLAMAQNAAPVTKGEAVDKDAPVSREIWWQGYLGTVIYSEGASLEEASQLGLRGTYELSKYHQSTGSVILTPELIERFKPVEDTSKKKEPTVAELVAYVDQDPWSKKVLATFNYQGISYEEVENIGRVGALRIINHFSNNGVASEGGLNITPELLIRLGLMTDTRELVNITEIISSDQKTV